MQADKDFIDTLAHIRSGKCSMDQLQDLETQCSSSLDMSDGILPTVVRPSEPGQALWHTFLPGMCVVQSFTKGLRFSRMMSSEGFCTALFLLLLWNVGPLPLPGGL